MIANSVGDAVNDGAFTVCADTHHVAESTLRPHGDGPTPTYDSGPRFEALTDADRRLRADTILDVMRGLQDRATLAGILVISRCLKRLDVMSSTAQHPTECTRDRCAVACPLDQWSVLDQALQLELTDVRLERERGEAQLCVVVDHGGRYCTAEVHQPSCPIGHASKAQNRAALDQAVPR